MADSYLVGVDIGGTKCAVTLALTDGNDIEIKDKVRFETVEVGETIRLIKANIRGILEKNGLQADGAAAIGISCGGPLDSKRGVVMSPPNLPGWDYIPIVDIISEEFNTRTAIHNDANACALAEWKFGAGRGTMNMAFLTFGTG
ncbi:MAG: ROK family protein, partial [Bacteroidales bacterium]|nr:ROK family protein [Bacteroidales bacterium]